MHVKTKFCLCLFLFVFVFVLFGCTNAKKEGVIVYSVCVSAPKETCIANDASFTKLNLNNVVSQEFGIELLAPTDFKKVREESVFNNAKVVSVDYIGSVFDIYYTEFFKETYPIMREMNHELFELLVFGAKNVNDLSGTDMKVEKDAAELFQIVFPNRKSQQNLVFVESEYVAMKYENGNFVIAYRGKNNDSLVIGELMRK